VVSAWPWSVLRACLKLYSCNIIFIVVGFLNGDGLPVTWSWRLLPRDGCLPAVLCVRRNGSYVYEIYYCSIAAGSQKICRNMVNNIM
jgi:hypothetical protein